MLASEYAPYETRKYSGSTGTIVFACFVANTPTSLLQQTIAAAQSSTSRPAPAAMRWYLFIIPIATAQLQPAVQWDRAGIFWALSAEGVRVRKMALCAQRQRVVRRRASRQSKPAAAYAGRADGCVCEAEELLGARTREDGVREFLVKWRDYGADANSWEPEHEFITSHLIDKLLAKDASAEPPKHSQHTDDQTEGERQEPTSTDAANSQATSPHSRLASEDEAAVHVEDDTHHHTGSRRSGNKPFSRNMRKPAAKRRLQLESSAPRAPAKKDKATVYDEPHTDDETGFSPTSSSPRADNAADSAVSPTPGVLITSSLAARLVEMDDFEDVMIDCFVWRLFKKTDKPALGTVVDFIRRPDFEYAFAGRWTDIHLLVRGTDGNVRPMRFIDLSDNPLTQEHIFYYRTAMLDHTERSGKWSKEWSDAKSRQLAEFLKL